MKSIYGRIMAFTALFLFSAFVSSGEPHRDPLSSLSTYIDRHCRSECITPELLHFGVEAVARETGVNPVTLLAIMKVESGFKPKALNTKSGRSAGLMQIQVRWHRDKFRTKNQFDVMDNLRVGATVYRDCFAKHRGSREKALLCYNGYQKNGMKSYVLKVLQAHKELEQMNLRFS